MDENIKTETLPLLNRQQKFVHISEDLGEMCLSW